MTNPKTLLEVPFILAIVSIWGGAVSVDSMHANVFVAYGTLGFGLPHLTDTVLFANGRGLHLVLAACITVCSVGAALLLRSRERRYAIHVGTACFELAYVAVSGVLYCLPFGDLY